MSDDEQLNEMISKIHCPRRGALKHATPEELEKRLSDPCPCQLEQADAADPDLAELLAKRRKEPIRPTLTQIDTEPDLELKEVLIEKAQNIPVVPTKNQIDLESDPMLREILVKKRKEQNKP
jgi:hypothetical protein